MKGRAEVSEKARDPKRVQQYFESIIDNIPIMLFVKEAEELRFELWNKAGEELLGLTRAEMFGKNDHDFFPAEQAEYFNQKDREVLAQGRMVAVEEPIATKHGERMLYTKKIPILDENGKPLFLVGISQDITEQKRAARELQLAKEVAEAANRTKSEFLANVSHELRTPLTLILSPLDALLADGALTPELRDTLGRMRRNAGRLALLVNDLLDFSTLEAGRLTADIRPEPVVDQVHGIVDDARPAALSRGLELRLDVDPSLGNAMVDRRMFEKIVINLIGNALKFTPRGGRIQVALAAEGDALALSVTDTGIGIPSDKLEVIFERFQQVDSSSTRVHGGTGLGLALVKEFAEHMGGTASVTSELGKGSRFLVRLPRALALVGASAEPDAARASAVHAFEPDEPPPLEPVSFGGKPRLVIAEDNDHMRAHLVALLSSDYDIVAVENGRLALESAREILPDVILSDIMMPEMDGIALVQAVKSDEALKQVPILLLTARAGTESVTSGLDRGADDYIAKPFSPAELRARLRAARRLHQATQDLALMVDELRQTRAELVEAERLRVAGTLADAVSQKLFAPLQELQANLLARAGTADLAADVQRVLGLVLGLHRVVQPPAATAPEEVDVGACIAEVVGALPPPGATLDASQGPIKATLSSTDLRTAVMLIAGYLARPQQDRPSSPSPVSLRLHLEEGRPCITLRGPRVAVDESAIRRLFEPEVIDDGAGGMRVDVDLALAQQLLRRNGGELRADALGDGAFALRAVL